MVRPAAFAYNPETAVSNRLQQPPAETSAGTLQQQAAQELQGCVRALSSEGIRVCVAEDTPEPARPDAVFPNNWVSFHEDGTLVLYPLQAQNRRPERRPEIIEQAVRDLGFVVRRTFDLTHHEAAGRFLEGTGSLVMDHVQRIVYACRSPRTDAQLVAEWAHIMNYETVVFDACDRNGVPLYHTNVMLSIGARAVVVGTQTITPGDRTRVLARLRAGGREIIEISEAAVARFAGNMLELATWDEALGDCGVLVMSCSARDALDAESFARLSACTDAVLAVPVPTIERLGGGSVRCMLAEVFLP